MSKVTKAITAENQFTDLIQPSLNEDQRDGRLNISISGTFVATVTLQRKFSDDANYYDVEDFYSGYEGYIMDLESAVSYRIGVKTGNYTSGTVNVRLSK